MNIEFSIEWLFFIIPLGILFIYGQTLDDTDSMFGSARTWFYIFCGPVALIIAFASWAIYLKFFD